MYGEEDIVKEDVNNILQRNGFSSNEFKITVETGTSYNPSQIVGTQVWITIEKNSIIKKYRLYLADWPNEFETDLTNGYFNN
jgi:hypothetical protein